MHKKPCVNVKIGKYIQPEMSKLICFLYKEFIQTDKKSNRSSDKWSIEYSQKRKFS